MPQYGHVSVIDEEERPPDDFDSYTPEEWSAWDAAHSSEYGVGGVDCDYYENVEACSGGDDSAYGSVDEYYDDDDY
ncbi:hypothetical protein CYMTET_16522 [Cymbomonas tetramitiformis]|uniref:Uncharacterized protein n=1 Tax=Cymbomonas tetramitiformis TaxID=36881 RepID=A0AAE0L825_9CHLO|nr:hypothetical protein CYMTET_16522 [Cymbomonas tetramitiformis]